MTDILVNRNLVPLLLMQYIYHTKQKVLLKRLKLKYSIIVISYNLKRDSIHPSWVFRLILCIRYTNPTLKRITNPTTRVLGGVWVICYLFGPEPRVTAEGWEKKRLIQCHNFMFHESLCKCMASFLPPPNTSKSP